MDYIIKLYKDWRLHSEFKEIVSDMEDDYFFTEKHSIRESARSLKKYGSTCNHVRNELMLIRHELEKTDTLQGIALKYGCTTEQIRRANRLFAQDSLFLRQFLMIPVDKDSPYYPKDDRPQSLPTGGSSANSCMSDMQTNSQNSQSMTVLSPEEENRKDIDEFMGKIDSTLAQTKKYVAKSQNSFDFIPPSDENLFTTNHHHHRHYATSPSTSSTATTASSSSRHHTRNSSSGSNSDTIQLLTMTSGRRVQNSLQRLEKQQDEFFEL